MANTKNRTKKHLAMKLIPFHLRKSKTYPALAGTRSQKAAHVELVAGCFAALQGPHTKDRANGRPWYPREEQEGKDEEQERERMGRVILTKCKQKRREEQIREQSHESEREGSMGIKENRQCV